MRKSFSIKFSSITMLVILLACSQVIVHGAEQPCPSNGNDTQTVALNPLMVRRARLAQRGPSQLRQVVSAHMASNITIPAIVQAGALPTSEAELLARAPAAPAPGYTIYVDAITQDYLANFKKRHPEARALEIRQRDANSPSLSPDMLRLIAEQFPTLEGLSVNGLNITHETASVLATHFTRLTALAISNNPLLGDDGIRILGALARLELLSVDRTGLTPDGAYILAQQFPNLRYLNVSGNEIYNEGLYRLSQATFAPRLYTLIVSDTTINTRAFSLLRNFSNLRVLNIANNNLGQYGSLVERLIDAPISRYLQELIISRNDINNAGRLALERSGVYPHLKIKYQANNNHPKTSII